MPNIRDYHESLTLELDAVKSRIRNLVTHWPTDGEWKEAALRTLLRRLLPSSNLVGRGFVVGREQSTSQIDLFVLRQGKPTLFRDGELAIVTPDVPNAIVEVKTSISGGSLWYEVVAKLARQAEFCRKVASNDPWLGVFAYEGNASQTDNILNAVCRIHKETGISIDCVNCGYDLFVRYWPNGQCEPGDDSVADRNREFWRAYELPRLSPSYFISNLVDAVCNVDRSETDYVWFAHEGGKRPHTLSEKRTGDCELGK